jgi:hypothetical protein
MGRRSRALWSGVLGVVLGFVLLILILDLVG